MYLCMLRDERALVLDLLYPEPLRLQWRESTWLGEVLDDD